MPQTAAGAADRAAVSHSRPAAPTGRAAGYGLRAGLCRKYSPAEGEFPVASLPISTVPPALSGLTR
jgi:hypothetical protein